MIYVYENGGSSAKVGDYPKRLDNLNKKKGSGTKVGIRNKSWGLGK